MRHAKSGRKLGRSYSHRQALMKNLATSFFTHGRLRVTLNMAKELQSVAEHMVTLAKRGDLHARRQAISMTYDDRVVSRLFSEIAPWYKERQGGYTRIMKIGPRPGDNALMAFIELVDRKPLGEIKTIVKPKAPFKNKVKKAKPEAPSGASGQASTKPKAVKAAKPAAKAEAPKKAQAKPKKKDDKA
jgi:large subunit ribosomal protein L17